MGIQVSYAVFTDAGNRPINEDAVGVCGREDGFCFLLCDGLGGHGMGDAASASCVRTFRELFEETSDVPRFLPAALEEAQTRILEEQKALRAKHKMKTTAVALVLYDDHAYAGYIGDSRLYVFENNAVKKRTKDHSIPQMLVEAGEIRESEIRNHPDRNMLLRVIGVDWDAPAYQLLPSWRIRKDQAFLLCSDGFWELIDETQMCELLKTATDPKDWINRMAQIVRENGQGKNMDNYSAIAVFCKRERGFWFGKSR